MLIALLCLFSSWLHCSIPLNLLGSKVVFPGTKGKNCLSTWTGQIVGVSSPVRPLTDRRKDFYLLGTLHTSGKSGQLQLKKKESEVPWDNGIYRPADFSS